MKRIGTVLLISLYTWCANPLFAQSKEEFEKIFLKETEGNANMVDIANFKHIEKLSYYPDTLPSWFFASKVPSANMVYAVGISDPDLPLEEAANQAISRGKALAALFSNAQIQFYRDVYSLEYSEGPYTKFNQRFDTYFKLFASIVSNESCFSVEQLHTTRYNEVLALVRYAPKNPGSASTHNLQISSEGTAFYIEVQQDDVFEPQGEYELISNFYEPNSTYERMHFTYREKGNRTLSISEYAGKSHSFPLYPYRYANLEWQQNTPPLVSYNGLWSMYIKDLLLKLALELEQNSIKIKTFDEHYDSQMRSLSREIAIKKSKLVISGIEFGDDRVIFHIDFNDPI